VKRAGKHEIADGHHRIAAAQHVGLTHIKAYVADSDKKEPHPGFDD
jgi:ParB-like chromosome segregation protein Spo0J